MPDVFNGANTSIAAPSQQAPKKNAHSDSAINSLAKSGGLMGVGKKIVSDFTPKKKTPAASSSSSSTSSSPTSISSSSSLDDLDIGGL